MVRPLTDVLPQRG